MSVGILGYIVSADPFETSALSEQSAAIRRTAQMMGATVRETFIVPFSTIDATRSAATIAQTNGWAIAVASCAVATAFAGIDVTIIICSDRDTDNTRPRTIHPWEDRPNSAIDGARRQGKRIGLLQLASDVRSLSASLEAIRRSWEGESKTESKVSATATVKTDSQVSATAATNLPNAERAAVVLSPKGQAYPFCDENGTIWVSKTKRLTPRFIRLYAPAAEIVARAVRGGSSDGAIADILANAGHPVSLAQVWVIKRGIEAGAWPHLK